MKYLIYNDEEMGFWNNDDGWGYRDTATVFEESELILNLPIGGRWVNTEAAKLLPDEPDEDE